MERAKRAFSISAFCERFDVGRTKVYEEIKAGRLRAVKAGKRTLITDGAAADWVEKLPELLPKPDGPQGDQDDAPD
jgi:excisionase family DNA binding protein